MPTPILLLILDAAPSAATKYLPEAFLGPCKFDAGMNVICSVAGSSQPALELRGGQLQAVEGRVGVGTFSWLV